jgi:hypothetical protein
MTKPKQYTFESSEAKREGLLLRMGICGVGGSGKTETSLKIATRMVERMGLGRVFVIDSESRSALRYAWSDKSQDGYRFIHVPMPEDDYSPAAYMAAIAHCEAKGAGVIIIDSLTHAWTGINGVLEQVDALTEASKSKNAFNVGWKAMTPEHNRLLQKILSAGAHVLFTVRAHTHYDLVEKNGKKEPTKMGLAPVQRGGLDYEPDLFVYMENPGNVLRVDKSRVRALPIGEQVPRPDAKFADLLVDYLTDTTNTGEARSLGEAVNMAVAEGVAAAERKDPEAYKIARGKLVTWAARRGVSQARCDGAVAEFKERVAAVAKQGPADAPPASGTANDMPAHGVDRGAA